MANNSSLVPQAREALNRYKMEAANEVGRISETGLQWLLPFQNMLVQSAVKWSRK